MPSFETSDHVSTRSVLRHRPIGTRSVPTGKHSVVTHATAPVIQRASRPRADATDDVVMWNHSDALNADERESYPSVHTQPGDRRALVVTGTGMPQTPRPRTGQIKRETTVVRRHVHPLLYLGVGMLGGPMKGVLRIPAAF